MKFTSSLAQFTGPSAKVYSLHIPIPADIKEQIRAQGWKRVMGSINGSPGHQFGIMHSAAYDYILVSKKFTQKLNLVVGTALTVELQKDESTYGMEMPEELSEMLNQDPLTNDYFHNLTPGKQRNLIYLVTQVKSTKSRMAKALAIADHLVNAQGKLDFKVLNERIKFYNQQNKLK